MRRLFVIVLLAFAGVGVALPAQAHNVLVGSDPKDGATLSAAPARITLVFDQAVRQGYAQVGVTGADGTTWADGSAEVAAEKVSVKVKPLRAGGAYVVGYRILSADGHPVTGKISFSLAADATAVQKDSGTQAQADTGADASGARRGRGGGERRGGDGRRLDRGSAAGARRRHSRGPAPRPHPCARRRDARWRDSRRESRDDGTRDGERADA